MPEVVPWQSTEAHLEASPAQPSPPAHSDCTTVLVRSRQEAQEEPSPGKGWVEGARKCVPA